MCYMRALSSIRWTTMTTSSQVSLWAVYTCKEKWMWGSPNMVAWTLSSYILWRLCFALYQKTLNSSPTAASVGHFLFIVITLSSPKGTAGTRPSWRRWLILFRSWRTPIQAWYMVSVHCTIHIANWSIGSGWIWVGRWTKALFDQSLQGKIPKIP